MRLTDKTLAASERDRKASVQPPLRTPFCGKAIKSQALSISPSSDTMARTRNKNGKAVAFKEDPNAELHTPPGSPPIQGHQAPESAELAEPRPSLVVVLPVAVPPRPKMIAKLPLRPSNIVGVANPSSEIPTPEQMERRIEALEHFWGVGARELGARHQQAGSPSPQPMLPPSTSPMRLRSSVPQDLERRTAAPGDRSGAWMGGEMAAPSLPPRAPPTNVSRQAGRRPSNAPSARPPLVSSESSGLRHSFAPTAPALGQVVGRGSNTTTAPNPHAATTTTTTNSFANMTLNDEASQREQQQQQQQQQQQPNERQAMAAPTTRPASADMAANDGAFQHELQQPTTTTTTTTTNALGAFQAQAHQQQQQQQQQAARAEMTAGLTAADIEAAHILVNMANSQGAFKPQQQQQQRQQQHQQHQQRLANLTADASTTAPAPAPTTTIEELLALPPPTLAQQRAAARAAARPRPSSERPGPAMLYPYDGQQQPTITTTTTTTTTSNNRRTITSPSPTDNNVAANNSANAAHDADSVPRESKEQFLARMARVWEEQEEKRRRQDREWTEMVERGKKKFDEEFPHADEELMAWRAQKRPQGWRYEE
ncbi:hypothetical protein IWX47DRAFT_941129 [Phyllosticta citricarpa]|uniref:Uncharacterized protein n=1 Tax=Phyllosticta citricarpa TaxID=55181 RepID=A0ABR1L784_9PEZI